MEVETKRRQRLQHDLTSACHPGWHGRLLAGAALALLAVAPLLGCGASQDAPSKPHILLLTLDTTRADHLGLHGYFRDTSPTLDALGEESIVFDRHIVPMATTLPTHLSILTGSHPLEHGVLANSTHGGARFAPSPKLKSFATVAAEAGYRTGGFVSATPLKRDSGIAEGFDHFDQPKGRMRDGMQTSDAALRWIGEPGDQPFFAWLHFYDAHWPFQPRPEYDTFRVDESLEAFIAEREIPRSAPRPMVNQDDDARKVANLYDAELRYQDDLVKRVIDHLKEVGAWEHTAVVIVGDHGEGLCQHGEAAHGGTWDEQLHAPLLIRVPGVEPRRLSALTSSSDALPTLTGLLGVPELEPFLAQASGRDVLSASFTEDAIVSQDTGRERQGRSFRFAQTDRRWKYFRNEQDGQRVGEELYDLSADPFELNDLSGTEVEKLAELRAQLEARLSTLRSRGHELRGETEDSRAPMDPETLEQLRALGYVDEGAESPQP